MAFWPAAAGGIYTGYKAYEGQKTLNWVGSQVQAEIDKKAAAPVAAPTPTAT